MEHMKQQTKTTHVCDAHHQMLLFIFFGRSHRPGLSSLKRVSGSGWANEAATGKLPRIVDRRHLFFCPLPTQIRRRASETIGLYTVSRGQAAGYGGVLPPDFGEELGEGGGGPSIASSPCAGKSRRLAASARMAAMDASAAQRSAQAAAAVDRAQVGSVRARARARCRTRCTASGDHRPPTSNPNTARRQRVLDWNSG